MFIPDQDNHQKKKKSVDNEKEESKQARTKSALPTSPANWNVSVEYERETVNLTDFMSQAVYDLEFSTRTLFRDANSSRIILSKEAMVRSSNQETETSKSVNL